MFVEERRQKKTITNVFGEKPVLKLMFYAMYRTAKRWRALKVIASNYVRWCLKRDTASGSFQPMCTKRNFLATLGHFPGE